MASGTLPTDYNPPDEQADLVHVPPGNVKDDGLVVDRLEGVLLYVGFLFQLSAQHREGHLTYGSVPMGAKRKAERVKQMSSSTTAEAVSPRLTVVLRWHQDVKQLTTLR